VVVTASVAVVEPMKQEQALEISVSENCVRYVGIPTAVLVKSVRLRFLTQVVAVAVIREVAHLEMVAVFVVTTE
jgi:hypothetical protein